MSYADLVERLAEAGREFSDATDKVWAEWQDAAGAAVQKDLAGVSQGLVEQSEALSKADEAAQQVDDLAELVRKHADAADQAVWESQEQVSAAEQFVAEAEAARAEAKGAASASVRLEMEAMRLLGRGGGDFVGQVHQGVVRQRVRAAQAQVAVAVGKAVAVEAAWFVGEQALQNRLRIPEAAVPAGWSDQARTMLESAAPYTAAHLRVFVGRMRDRWR